MSPLSRDCHDPELVSAPPVDVGASSPAVGPSFCPYCQAALPASAKVCPSCAKYPTGCAVCGSEVKPGAPVCARGHFQRGNRKAWRHGLRSAQHGSDYEQQLEQDARATAEAWGVPYEPFAAELKGYADLARRAETMRTSQWAAGAHKAAAKSASQLSMDMARVAESVTTRAREIPGHQRDERREAFAALDDAALFLKLLNMTTVIARGLPREYVLDKFADTRDAFLPRAQVLAPEAAEVPSAPVAEVESAPIDVAPASGPATLRKARPPKPAEPEGPRYQPWNALAGLLPERTEA
jgi:hypothetical protein